jgi:hypothetical protein
MDTLLKVAPIRRILAKKPYTFHGFEGWLLKLECAHIVFKPRRGDPIGHLRECHLCLAEKDGQYYE